MRLIKALVTGIGLLLIAAAVAVLALYPRLEPTLHHALEAQLSRLYLTDVTIGQVRIEPLRGLIELRAMTVANPPGFRPGPAFEIGRTRVRVKLPSLLTETPVIHAITLENVEVFLRMETGDGTNLRVLARNAQQLAEAERLARLEGPLLPAADAPRRTAPPRTFLVEEFRCEGALVRISANLVPLVSVPMKIAPFTLREVSRDKPIGLARTTVIFLKSLMLEIVTLRGFFRPVVQPFVDLMTNEADTL